MPSTKNMTTKIKRPPGSRIPFGYKLCDNDPDYIQEITTELDAVKKVLPMIKSRSLSNRDVAEWLKTETGRHIGKDAIDTMRENRAEDGRIVGLVASDEPEWVTNPERFQTNEDGTFILKKDGTPKKRAGRGLGTKSRNYTYSTKQKQTLAEKRNYAKNAKRLKKLA